MEWLNYLDHLAKIINEATILPPGILQKGKSMTSQLGHTVINLSDVTLIQGFLETSVPEKPFPQGQW